MRFSNWETRLSKAIEEARNKEYKLGEHDCALFAINIIREICGIDYGERIRGLYSTKAGYLRLWKEIGGSSLKEITEIILGKKAEKIEKAKRGDLVLNQDEEDHLGICTGAKVVIASIEGGLVFVDLLDCSCCWRIN